ncbi:MAG: acyl-CoA dehydrogenase family protein [Sphingomonadaceae bacterium]|nr:acyl-CoA dehydrogenase family protein [Sphingomonadaceae bacterium]
MDLLTNDDQQQLADAFARAALEMFPLADEHARATDAQWLQVAELGWLGIAASGAAGGSGLSLAETALLFREIGRQLVPGPLLSSVLGAKAAAIAGDTALAAAIIAGERRVALLSPPDARAVDRRLRVIDGEDADLGLLPAPDATRVYALPADREVRVSVDPAASLALCRLPPEPLLTVPTGTADLFAEAVLLIAATAAGMCEAIRDESAGYAKIREQFGRPIGMFQAVSHRCADMAARADVAWLQVVMAALCHDADAADARFQIDAARITAVGGALAGAQDNVQNHGGMGFTEELPPHRFVKRAFLLDQLLGGRRATLDRILAVPRAVVHGDMRAA